MEVNTTRRQKQRAARKRASRKPMTGASLLLHKIGVAGSMLLLLLVMGKREGQEALPIPTAPLASAGASPDAAAAAAGGGSIIIALCRAGVGRGGRGIVE